MIMSDDVKFLIYLVIGLCVFWFLFGVISSKMGKRPYDEDTKIKDGTKSMVGFLVVIGILVVLYFVYYIFAEILT